MENYDLRYGENRYTVAAAPATERALFIQRVYGHVAGAVLAFVAIEAVLLQSGLALPLMKAMFGIKYAPLLLMGLFIGGGYLAQYMARSATSNAARYAGLGLYVVLEAIIILPLLYIAEYKFPGQYLALQAGIITLAAFAGLTLFTVWSKRDFSFLGPVLWVLSFAVLGLIIASLVFGFNLGVVFAFGMVAFMAVAIVYQTSNVMYHYGPNEYVSAALELFGSIATMFFYVLRILMSFSNND